MLYRTMPKSDDQLSILGFGCMRFPTIKDKINEPKSRQQIERAIEQGINYFDTAYPYHMGASEPFVGKTLKEGGLRDKIYLATKLPPWSVKTRADMDLLLNTQLGYLQTDHVDYYLVHSLRKENWQRMKELGVLSFLEEAKRDGRIRHAGFSFHGDRETFPQIVDAYDWTFCQIQYNYLDTRTQAGMAGLKYAAKKRLGVIVMEPLRGGGLAKQPPASVQAIWNAAEVQRSPAEWALRWIWDHPEVSVVLSGMTEDANLEENLRIAEDSYPNAFTENEHQTIRHVQKIYSELMQIGCTNCRYCMPCPSGVDIPTCFHFYNDYHMFDPNPAAKMLYVRMGGITAEKKSTYASNCTECGECVQKCPQSLEIPALLKKVKGEFETGTTKYSIQFMKWMITLQSWMLRFRSPQKRVHKHE